MQNLENLIRLAKENDENAMLKIIEKFEPLINKYFKKSQSDEDVKSEIIMKLIKVVKFDLKFDRFQELNDGAIISYIATSLKRHYYAIFDKNNKTLDLELACEDETIITLLDSTKMVNEMDVENMILSEILRTILNEKEYECVYYIVFMGYTAEELSKKLKITKQACNQCKQRAFEKIRLFYENHKN